MTCLAGALRLTYPTFMFGMGMTELLVIFAVALLVLGPKKLPELATGLGKAIREFRKATRDLSDQIEVDESVRRPIAELKAALRDEPIPRVPMKPLPVAAPPTTTVSSPTTVEFPTTASTVAPAPPKV